MKEWIRAISRLGACKDAMEWAESYDSLPEAWAACERGDWMLWLLGRLSGEPGSEGRRKLVLTTCQCARLALPYVVEGEERPRKTIEVTEAWAKNEGGITLEDIQNAAEGAAYAAKGAASHAAAYVAYYSVLKECADIVRAHHDAPRN